MNMVWCSVHDCGKGSDLYMCCVCGSIKDQTYIMKLHGTCDLRMRNRDVYTGQSSVQTRMEMQWNGSRDLSLAAKRMGEPKR